jgi:flagellar biosynthesis/type III secretory pathway protein FliH
MKRQFFVPVVGVTMLALAGPAQAQLSGWPAQGRPSYTEDSRQPYYEARRGAYDNGYREGLKEGEREGRRRERYDYQDERTWQRADHGYHRSSGDRERYRQSFRSGYAAGYSDAYQRYAPNYGYGGYGNGRPVPQGNTGPYGYPQYPNRNTYPGQYGYGYGYSPAFANGERDGYEKGLEDARDRDSFDPLRHKWYRSGDRDYRREYGSREQYEDAYRRGFREGYERGYRYVGYRRY